jgi:AraC-like DNA-binding protein
MTPFPLASCPGYHTKSIEQARRHISRFFRIHGSEAPDGMARIDFRHHYASLGDITVNALRYGAEVRIESRPLKDFYLAQWTLEGDCRYGPPGKEAVAGPGTLYVVNPFEPHRKLWSSTGLQVILRIDRDTVDRHVALMGAGGTGPVRFAAGPHAATPSTAILFDFLAMVQCSLDAGAPQLASAAIARHLQDTLLGLLLATIDNDRAEPLAGIAAPPAHLRDAVDFIKVHARDPVGPGDIARATGVRQRTLQKSFQGHMGMSPGAYLKGVRLDLVRRDLEEGGVNGPSVTEIAMECGFQHMGRFARDFRDRFGVTPSAWRAGRGRSAARSSRLEQSTLPG